MSFDPPLLPTSGDSCTLRCTAVKLNMGFTGTPEIFWLSNSGFVGLDVMMSDNQTTSSTLSIEYLKASASGRYTCISSLDTPIPNIHIIRSIEEVLAIKCKHHFDIIIRGSIVLVYYTLLQCVNIKCT